MGRAIMVGMALAMLLGAACAVPDASGKKPPAAVCDDEGKACPEQTGARPNGSTGRPKGELPVSPVIPDRDPPAEANPDAGPAPVADAGPTLGPSCTKLKECCTSLREASITGSANQCDSVVADGNEVSCASVNEDYKQPDEYYDPVCF